MPRKTDGIEFEIHPRPTKGEDGKPLLYVRPAKGRKKSFKELENFCNKYRGLRTGELQQVMDVLMEVVALWVSDGYRVETPLGSFAPKLKLLGEHTDPKTIHGRDVVYAGLYHHPRLHDIQRSEARFCQAIPRQSLRRRASSPLASEGKPPLALLPQEAIKAYHEPFIRRGHTHRIKSGFDRSLPSFSPPAPVYAAARPNM